MQNINPDPTGTPIYLKTGEMKDWPQHKVFYLLTRDGLFLCRNHEWFQSCVLAKRGPGELAEHKESLSHSYPSIPRLLLEKAVGFFSRVHEQNQCESALILAWNRLTNQMELYCPEQEVSLGSVHYQIPNLPHHLALIGDLHSHGTMSPSPSITDKGDEMGRAGLHIIVGGIQNEPPEFYCAIVADGHRFTADIDSLIEDYQVRNSGSVPQEWLDKVNEKKFVSAWGSGEYGGQPYIRDKRIDKIDRETEKRILSKFAKESLCPVAEDIRKELFTSTKLMTYLECEKKADEFVKNWYKMKGHHEKQVA
jgi:PRTRC genetic system protein A